VTFEWWSQNGISNRKDGPARSVWSPDGTIKEEEWWIDGVKLTPPEIERILRPADLMAVIWTLPLPIAEEIAAEYRAV